VAQVLENTGTAALQFTPAELAELNSAVPAIKARCGCPRFRGHVRSEAVPKKWFLSVRTHLSEPGSRLPGHTGTRRETPGIGHKAECRRLPAAGRVSILTHI
jgi:hypothetical protein